MGFLDALFGMKKGFPPLDNLEGDDAKRRWAISRAAVKAASEWGYSAGSVKDSIQWCGLHQGEYWDDWVFWHCFCDWCLRDQRWKEAIRAGERLLELRPQDPRSTYALASVYHALAALARSTGVWGFHRDYLDLTPEQATAKARDLFRATVGLGVRPRDEKRLTQWADQLDAALATK